MIRSRGGLVSKARAARKCAPLIVPSRTRAAYVGWLGRQNMGDEAMFLAYRRAFSGWRLVQPPRAEVLSVLDSLTPHRLLDAVILGGGTLVGWPSYRNALARLLSLDDGLPAVTMGIGVEDPIFLDRDEALAGSILAAEDSLGIERTNGRSRRSPGNACLERELERWAEMLSGFRRVSVRGPRSREILAGFGLATEVVGDPALLLADDSPSDGVTERLLGINIGVSRALWGDPDALLEQVVTFGREMVRRGWRLRFVPVWPRDVPSIVDAARRIGSSVEVFEDYLDLPRLLSAIRECQVFVGQKLHAVVFASAVYVPSIMLEYQPKCADFQRSLGGDQYMVRTDRVDASALTEMAEDLAARYDYHRASLVSGVSSLRGRLEREVEEIRRIVDEGR